MAEAERWNDPEKPLWCSDKTNKMYRNIILPVDLYGCENWLLTEGGMLAEVVRG
jgi:hypothetical protein